MVCGALVCMLLKRTDPICFPSFLRLAGWKTALYYYIIYYNIMIYHVVILVYYYTTIIGMLDAQRVLSELRLQSFASGGILAYVF